MWVSAPGSSSWGSVARGLTCHPPSLVCQDLNGFLSLAEKPPETSSPDPQGLKESKLFQ